VQEEEAASGGIKELKQRPTEASSRPLIEEIPEDDAENVPLKPAFTIRRRQGKIQIDVSLSKLTTVSKTVLDLETSETGASLVLSSPEAYEPVTIPLDGADKDPKVEAYFARDTQVLSIFIPHS